MRDHGPILRAGVPSARALSFAAACLALVGLWIERHRQRRHLAGLEDHQLLDIGRSRAEAEMEAAKPFWRP